MRICFLATTFVDYSAQLAEQLPSGDRLLFIADRLRASEPSTRTILDRLAACGHQVATLSQRRIWSRTWFALRAFVHVLRFRPDVLIAHEHVHPHIAVLLRIAGLFTKVFLIVHDPAPHIGRDAAFANRNAWCGRWLRASASVFFVHGEYCRGQLRALLGEGDSRTIVDIPLGPQLRPDAALPFEPSRRVLIFGRMEAYKGLDVALEAVRLLRGRNVRVELRVVGSGPELDRLQRDFEEIGSVVVNRYVTSEEVIAHFRWCSAVLAPYLEATQSGIVSLSFACGRPVIASAVGGLPDFIVDGGNGVLVPPADPNLVADALERTLADPQTLAHLARGAAQSGATTQSWPHVGARVRTELQNHH